MFTEEMFVKLFFLAAGLIIGALCLPMSKQLIIYKCTKKGRSIPECRWFSEDKYICIGLLGVLFFASASFFSPVQAALVCMFCVTAVIGALVDFQIRIIPNEVTIIVLLLGIVFNLTQGGWMRMLWAFLSGVLTLVIFLMASFITCYLVKSMGVGLGDIKLAVVAAFAVGPDRLMYFFAGIVLTLMSYLLFGLYFRRLTIGSTFPMGGQLAGGMVVALLLPPLLQITGMAVG